MLSLVPRRFPMLLCLLICAGCSKPPTPAEKAAQTLPGLIQKLKDDDPRARGEAAHEIKTLGLEHTKEAIPHLLANFEDEDRLAREWAAGIVALYGMEAAPGVLEAVQSTNTRRRAMAFYSIASFPGDVKQRCLKETLPLLVKGLRDDEVEVRRQAAWALSLHGSLVKSTLPIQLEVLQKDRDKVVRFHILKGLGMMGEDAREALPALEKFRDEPDAELRALALRSKFFVEGGDKSPE